jgi:hypothetical protein
MIERIEQGGCDAAFIRERGEHQGMPVRTGQLSLDSALYDPDFSLPGTLEGRGYFAKPLIPRIHGQNCLDLYILVAPKSPSYHAAAMSLEELGEHHTPIIFRLTPAETGYLSSEFMRATSELGVAPRFTAYFNPGPIVEVLDLNNLTAAYEHAETNLPEDHNVCLITSASSQSKKALPDSSGLGDIHPLVSDGLLDKLKSGYIGDFTFPIDQSRIRVLYFAHRS